jgi:diguanylate cyclase (GGDEF)-like protein
VPTTLRIQFTAGPTEQQPLHTFRTVSASLTGPDGRMASAYLLFAGMAILVHRLLPTGSIEQNVLYDLIGLATVVAVLVGIRVNRPPRVLPWLLIAASQLLFVTGDALWTALALMGESPFPSVADVAYLLGYPLLVVAFAVSIRLRVRGGDRSGVLDGSILAAASALVGWVVLVRPVFDAADDPLSLVISAAYPLGDLLVLGVAIGLIATPGARTPSFVMLITSIAMLFVADTAYAFEVAAGTYVDGGVLDVLWLASYVTIGAAALHGSMREVAAPHPVAVAWLSRTRLSLLALAMLTGPALVLIVDLEWDSDVPILALGSALLSLLVLVRLSTVVGALARDNAVRVKLEGELSYRASHDPLTGLPNRRRFIERLEGVLAARGRQSLAVLFLDLDDFKTVNDSLGHAAGDALLVAVATRLQRQVREEDLAARLGGDEFGIILEGKDAAAAARVADRLLAALDEPIEVDGRQLVARASIGIVDGSAPGVSAAQLLSDADIAMYQAKADGKGRVRIYEAGARSALQDRLELESDLREAIGRAELRLDYQPIINLLTRRTVGLEALVRWEHPVRGRLDPDTFVPLAEAAGLIHDLGVWVLREGCRQLAGWRAAIDPDLVLSVNLSARQLLEPALASTIDAAARDAGVPATALIIEVTESALLEDSDIVLQNLDRIRATGARVAIDDFGTGYSSLSYLSRLPADILKIDRAFVEELDRAADRGLAAVVVRLGETLELETIAEGVARPSQLHALRELGCHLAQGYLFSGPLASTAVTAWLTAERADEVAMGHWKASMPAPSTSRSRPQPA